MTFEMPEMRGGGGARRPNWANRPKGTQVHYLAPNLAGGESYCLDFEIQETAQERRLLIGGRGMTVVALYWKAPAPDGVTDPLLSRSMTSGRRN
jgi:hypothetical protein